MRLPNTPTLLLLMVCGPLNAAYASDHGGRASITFFEHAGFRGASFTVHAGDALENLIHVRFNNGQVMNDRISSFRIDGDAHVTVFRDAGFRGERERFEHSVANLDESAPEWNDVVSSLRVEQGSRGRDSDHGRANTSRIDATIRRAYRDVLHREPDEGGLRDYRRHMIQDHWTEEQLRHSLRESDEFRPIANRIIVDAYRDVLGREPSPRELRRMREEMIRQGWAAADVRKALRRDHSLHDRAEPPRKH